jgi:phytol kinase
MLQSNWYALPITFFIALLWLRLNDLAAQKGWISSRLSRKLIHIGTGPLFVLCWPLFTDEPVSRYLAALVPLTFSVQFALIGLGVIKDEASVKAMSRTGDPREILRGPLYYGIIFVVMTVLFWLDTPIGIVALMLMCGGDGLADILGRRFGVRKLPWTSRKSWVGSLGMFLGGLLFSILIMIFFVTLNIFDPPLSNYLLPIFVIAVVGTAIESLPFQDIDNITVTLTAVILGLFLF